MTTATRQLTDRELQVAGYVADGLYSKEIAFEMGISLHTVRAHLRNISVKLDMHSRTEIARYVMRGGE